MTKIVINCCFGGFGLSETAVALYFEKAKLTRHVKKGKFGEDYNYAKVGDDMMFWSFHELQRNDPILIAVVEELGPAANSSYAKLKVVEIADDGLWEIAEYDGIEHIAEQQRTWS